MKDLTHTVRQLSIVNDDGKVWFLRPSKYRAYGLTILVMNASTVFLAPNESLLCIVQTPLHVRVKVERGLETIFELSDDQLLESLDPKVCLPHTSTPKSQSFAGSCWSILRHPLMKYREGNSVFLCLKYLASQKGSRNVFKLVDYSNITIHCVEFLPPWYDVDVIFKFPPLHTSSNHSKAKQL